MKRISLSSLPLLLACGLSFSLPFTGLAGNYIITIDGKEVEVDEDKESTLTLENGQKVKVLLKKKDILSYATDTFSFDHSKHYNPARTDLGANVFQSMLVTPIGTAVMIQEYKTLNPANLIDMMVDELTKEEVNYGYKLTESPETMTLSDGTVLKGKKVVTTHDEGAYTRYILAASGKGKGNLFITQIERDNEETESEVIDLFWKSLKVNLK